MTIFAEANETFNQAQFLVDRHLIEGKGGNTASYYKNESISYSHLAEMVNRTGNVFKTLGVEIENRIAIILPDCPELLYAYLGAIKIGAIPVPLNTIALTQDYLHFLNNSRAKVLVLTPDVLPKIETIKNELIYLNHIVLIGQAAKSTLSFNKLLNDAPKTLEAARTSRDDMAFWMYTSGTTGYPKGVVHLQHDILFNLPTFCEEILKITEKDIVFSSSKIFFSYGRNNSLEIPLSYGASAVLYPEWPVPRKIIQVVEKYRPTLFFSVPTFYQAILKELEDGPAADFSSVRMCISAGEALPQSIYNRWQNKFGIQIIDAVGSTDVGANYLSNYPDDCKPNCSGKLINGFEGVLRDEEGNQVSSGKVGTLWLKNDGIAQCYWNHHDRSKQVFQGEWFNTGDRFYRDNDGYYYFQGREDDMLKISGQWVSPLEIERVLLEHPAVRDCGVIGMSDATGLIKVKAFVLLNDEYTAINDIDKSLIEFVRNKAAHFKTPRWIQFVKELPRTSTGKLQRYKLRQNI